MSVSSAEPRRLDGPDPRTLSSWTGRSADPLVAANVYLGGRLDEVLARVVEPCWTELATLLPGSSSSYLWCLRSPRGGEHLKIRVHGPGALGLAASELISQSAQRLFSESPAQPVEQAGTPQSRRQPILDEADLVNQGHPDRSLIYTTQVRHPALFGVRQLGSNDDYVARFTACLGRGREVAAALRTDSVRDRASARRQKMLRLLVLGLATLWPDIEQRTTYIAYHRDWLVRFPVLSSGAGKAGAQRRLERYETALRQMGEQFLSALGRLWSAGGAPEDSEVAGPWREDLLALREYLEKSQLRPDPFAQGATFPCIFKMLHALANQAGLNPGNEGLVYHILLRAAGEPFAPDSVCLVPS